MQAQTPIRISSMAAEAIAADVRKIDFGKMREDLDAFGWASLGDLLSPSRCVELSALFGQDAGFRSRVIMARHGFGQGEYKYFTHPLPDAVSALRSALYPPLAKVANDWHALLNIPERFPASHADFLEQCHEAGQAKPTPLLLRYGPGDYNCLHQDLYGKAVFPLQVVVLLSQPEADFSGGDFVLVEQRPRMQSRPEVVPIRQGEAIVFPVHHRPVRGTRGVYRVNMRHGVSRLRAGQRHTLGIIFHDAA